MNNLNKKNLIITVCFFFVIIAITCFPIYKNIKTAIWYVRFGYTENKVSEDLGIEKNIKKTITQFETNFESNIPLRNQLIEANGFLYKTFDIDFCATNDAPLMKLKNGHLVFKYSTTENQADDCVKNIIALNDYLFKKNIPFLYVQAPSSDFYEYNDRGVISLQAKLDNDLCAKLRDNGIDVWQMKDYFSSCFANPYEAFYKTDHHWTNESSFSVFQKLCEILNDKYNMQIASEMYDKDNFIFDTVVKGFCGSIGQKMGELYSGLDYLTIIKPDFDTDLNMTIHTQNKQQQNYSGSFEQALIYDQIEENPSYFVYMKGSNPPFIEIENKKENNGKTLIIIKDSYASPISAFLSTAFEKIIVLDFRYLDDSEKNINTYIENYNPDMVLTLVSTDTVCSDNRLLSFTVE